MVLQGYEEKRNSGCKKSPTKPIVFAPDPGRWFLELASFDFQTPSLVEAW